MNRLHKQIAATVVAGACAISASSAFAQGREGVKIFGGDFSMNTFIRADVAVSTSSTGSPANQYGDRTTGLSINRQAGTPNFGQLLPGQSQNYVNTAWDQPLTVGGLVSGLSGVPLPGAVTGLPLTVLPGLCPFSPEGVSNSSCTGDTFTNYIQNRDPDLNHHQIRIEATPKISWNDWALITRFRAVYDPGDFGYRDFDYADFTGINGGIQGGVPKVYHGKPNHLGYHVEEDDYPLLFERSGRNYSIDAPAFFIQWTNGQSTFRLGNQSVAWGQLLFFRLMDVANGLDLRRHLFLDRAIEEFADERMSAPGLRFTHQINNEIVFDSFAQQFIPTIIPSANTPYNIVDSRFTVRDRYVQGGYDEKINAGFRIKAEYGAYNWQIMYTTRYNQLGKISWANSDVDKALPNSNALGLAFNQACQALIIPNYNTERGTNLPTNNGCGPLLALTAFEASPGGVQSAEQWFDRASYTKLAGIEGLNRAVDDFPAAGYIVASPIFGRVDNQTAVNAANNELDAFFIASEGLRGHVQRTYHRESIFGIGGGIVTTAEPGSFFDQIVINMEATYSPDRYFTPIDLSQAHDIRDEYQVGLVVEKYHRFSQSLPAVYMVFQYLWQKESDLAGLLLDGYGSENFNDADNPDVVLTPGVPTGPNPTITPGIDEGANYVVLAALQPGQSYVFEYSIAMLIDVQGGILAQPAVQWKPRGNVTVNLFYNYLESDAWGGNPNKNLVSFIDFADEVVLRLGFQF